MSEKPKKSPIRLILIIVGGIILFLCIFGFALETFFPTETTPTPDPVAEAVEDTEE
jgi:hypothetical protein